MASEIERSSQNSFLSWKWQWLLDQRKQFNDRVDKFMTQLNDKFFTCADVVREQLLESAFIFLSQPVPSIDDLTVQKGVKNTGPQVEGFEELQNAVKKLEKQTEQLEEGSQKQKDELAHLRSQTQESLDKHSEGISSLEDRLQGLDDTTDKIQEEITEIVDKRLKDMQRSIHQLKRKIEKDSKRQQKDRKSLSELKNSQKLALKACAQHLAGLALSHKTTTTAAATTTTQVVSGSGDKASGSSTPPISQGATPTPVTTSHTLAKRPKGATIVNGLNFGYTTHRVELLSGGKLLITQSTPCVGLWCFGMALSLYSSKHQRLQSFEFPNTNYCTIVIQEPLVAVIGGTNSELHLMHVTESKITKQSTHKLDKRYWAVALIDVQTLAVVCAPPRMAVDVIDLKGQVKSSFCADHCIYHIAGTGDGGVLYSGDGRISGYDVLTQTLRFSFKVDQIFSPGALTYLPDSDSIIVNDNQTKSLCLLDGSTGSFISLLAKGVGDVQHIAVSQADTLVYCVSQGVKFCKLLS